MALLDKNPNQKLEGLAAALVPIAFEMKFTNRSGDPLNAETIRRHALYGIHREHKERRRK
jgi:hypothetical protein